MDTTRAVRTLSPVFFGVNYTAFWEPAEGSVASARALARTPIRTVRFPGGAPADFYDWQDPYYAGRSRTSPLQLWTWARSFGASHIVFQTNYQGNLPNPPGKSYAVNSPANTAAWVAYDLRHHIPADMEVGNEADMHELQRAEDPAYERYIHAFIAQASAMHRVNRHVRVLGPAGTNAWFWWKLGGLHMFVQGLRTAHAGDQLDAVSLHYYDASDWAGGSRAAQWWLSPHGPWSAIQGILSATQRPNLPVDITEWNLGNTDFHNSFNPTLGHALAVADMIGAFALSGVHEEDYFTIHRSDGWGLLYGTHDTRRVESPTPTYYAMVLWKYMGRRMVSLRESLDPAVAVSGYASTDTSGAVSILLINKQARARPVTIQVGSTKLRGRWLAVYSLVGVTKSVNDLDAKYDGVRMPSPQRALPGPLERKLVRQRQLQYSVPGYSAVVLRLLPRSQRQRSIAASHL